MLTKRMIDISTIVLLLWQKHSFSSTKVNNPWITKGILNYIHKRNRLYKKSLLSENNKKKYKRYRNTLTTLIRLSRKLYYSTKIENNKDNNNSLWQIIKDLIDSKRTNKTKLSIIMNRKLKILNKFLTYLILIFLI